MVKYFPDKLVWLNLAMLFFLVAASGITGCAAGHDEPPLAVKGRLDLSSWDFSSQGPVNLAGEWGFYSREFVEPLESSAAELHSGMMYLHAPGLWGGMDDQGNPPPASGYGSYRLRVKLPRNSGQPLTIYINGILSVCRVWVNGAFLGGSGVPGRDPASEKPRRHFIEESFYPAGESLDIILHVSNYHNKLGGLNGRIQLGTSDQIGDILGVQWISGAFMAGILLCISVYHLSLFFLRRTDGYYLYLGLFCLIWFAGVIFSPSFGFLMDAFGPALPWTWYVTASLILAGLTTPIVIVFYHGVFPKKYGKTVNRIYWTICLTYIVYLTVTPANAYDPVVFIFFLLSRTAFVYLACCFVIDFFNKKEGVLLLAPAYLALFFSEFDDMLFDLNLLNSADFGPYGVLLFILTYSFFLSSRFTRAFSDLDSLSLELEANCVRLEQLNKLKNEFLANTTHELKTPLAGMVGAAEGLLADVGVRLPEDARDDLRMLVHSGKRLSNLVNDVLDLSRLEHHDIPLHPEPVSPYAAVERVLALARRLASGRDIVLYNKVTEDLPMVWADQDRLEQILFNLAGNSIKYTERGSIVISGEVRDGWAELSVVDTGVGIPREEQERIFKAYEQIRGNGGAAPGGAGLGLAIARRLVELHGGTIRVRAFPGQGSTFTFTLPLYDERKIEHTNIPHPLSPARGFRPELVPDIPEDEADHGEVAGGRYQVLIVDDEQVNRRVIGSCLKAAGITYRTAGDGKTALRMISRDEAPDLLLLDVMMPGLNGYEVCRMLREEFDPAALPVVLLTVKNRVEDIVEGFAAGANDYLTKPFSREELTARVAAQLKFREAYSLLAENLELKKELELRRETEHALWLEQMRLSGMLDSMDDAIAALNPSKEIGFCNESFAQLIGLPVKSLLGIPFSSLLREPEGPGARGLAAALSSHSELSGRTRVFEGVILAGGGAEGVEATLFITGVELEEEPLVLMIARRPGTADGGEAALASAAMLREVDANRKLIDDLKETLNGLESLQPGERGEVQDNLKALDALLENIAVGLETGQPVEDKRLLAVKVMRLSVDCWRESTGSAKADLAEQSRLWTVYMEKDGYCRTQTMDKYLNEETLPPRPRWRNILATGQFVLSCCDPDLSSYQELAHALTRLKALA